MTAKALCGHLVTKEAPQAERRPCLWLSFGSFIRAELKGELRNETHDDCNVPALYPELDLLSSADQRGTRSGNPAKDVGAAEPCHQFDVASDGNTAQKG